MLLLQFGFKRQKSTGSVDISTVVSSGRYLLGPDFEFKTFPSDAHFVRLKEAKIFLSDKLEVKMNVNFQYFLRKDELKLLHKTYDVYYKDVVESKAIDAIKGASPNFSTRQMINNRRELEEALFKAVRERLGGRCCRPNCSEHDYACPSGCIPVENCKEEDKGMFLDVKYFQIEYIDIPSTVEDEYLNALTLLDYATREKLVQEAKVVRKNTSAMVEEIKNQVREITEIAHATASLTNSVAQANYSAIIEGARTDGLKNAFAILGVTDQQYKNSIDYLRELKGNKNIHMTVDFQQRIVGKL
ncbi:hypothetical protein FSP39_017936 [Pinctada imbricata]|uniref:Band 7 domain-containing protein n=1 Tax=Pinctada imbricata TaxID=66713 RepID=A0AA89BL18_PINIB|nr:hypothetical protein FSP39_017936 [Pinctada imbricata]